MSKKKNKKPRFEIVRLDKLTPFEDNPRKNDAAVAGVVRSMVRHGFTTPMLVDRAYNICAGHTRYKAAKRLGIEEVPVMVLDMDQTDFMALNITDNKSAEKAEWDEDKLPALLKKLQEEDFPLDELGFTDWELTELLNKLDEGKEKLDRVPPTRDTDIEEGDLFQLGKHRLLCGDATKEKDVLFLMDGKKAFIMITDPPYGVNYNPQWRNDAADSIGKANRRVGNVENDDRMDWSDAWRYFKGDVAYIWHAGRHAVPAIESLEKVGFEVRAQLVWKKPRFVISRGHYHWQHEPCWYAVRKGKKAHWCGNRSQSTIWEIDPAGTDKDNNCHGTQKPVECMARPMRNHGERGCLIYDPFIGSGSTLIAAETTDRICYGMEIEPVYCQVVIDRWEQATGGKARKLT